MCEVFSKYEDCQLLARKLRNELGNNIAFDGVVTEIINGEYLSSYRIKQGEYGHEMPFYAKFSSHEFLRIGVGSYDASNSLGEKMAALSDFYQVLREEYGEPTVFYTTKDDEEAFLNLHWSFIHQKEEIEDFKSGKYFDDAETDTLIILGEKDTLAIQYGFSQKEKEEVSRKVGLPFELLWFMCEDMETFIKHKTGSGSSFPSKKKGALVKQIKR